MESRKKLLIVGGIGLVVAGAVGFGAYKLVTKSDNKDTTGAVQEDAYGGPKFIETVPVDDLKAQFAQPTDQYAALWDAAMTAQGQANNDAAIEYFKAAAAVSGVDQGHIDRANLSVYLIGQKTGNQALMDEYKAILGDKLETLMQPTQRDNFGE